MPRSRPSAKPCLTIRCFGRCLGPVLLSRPDCSPPSVNNVSVIRAPPRFSATPASLPSPRAVATSTGSTGDCNAPRSYGRPLSNGLAPPFQDRSGPLPIIDSNATKVAPTRRPCAPWPSNGFAFCIAVGRPDPLTMSPPISMRSNAAARRYSLRSWGLQKILDRQSQGVSLQDHCDELRAKCSLPLTVWELWSALTAQYSIRSTQYGARSLTTPQYSRLISQGR